MDVAARRPASRGSPAGPRARSRRQPLLGGLLVKDGLINRAQLHRMLMLQQERDPRPLLGQMLLDEKLITPHELSTVLSKYRRTPPLGNVLIETKAVTPSQLETALAAHWKTQGQLGEVLIRLGFINERQLKQALGIQLGIPLVDLDDLPIDSDVTPLISEHYARHHRVVPIARVEDRLVLAMDDPTDVEVIAEVRSCTGRPVDVVTTTAAALDRALSRGYAEHGDVRPVSPTGVDADQTTRRETMESMTETIAFPEQGASRLAGGTPRHRDGDGERTRSVVAAVALHAVRARIDAIRQAARSWERRIDTVEALLRERLAQRAEIERLAGKLRENRTALARAYHELEEKAQALTRVEKSRATELQDREALEHSLRELKERHDALLQDRDFVIDRVSELLGRLRS